MQKLNMLIDIYEEEVVWVHSVWEKITDKEEARIISKKFWFIKWLVRNEHIDFKKLDTPRFNQLVDNTLDSYFALLMLLSIQDEPIDFLISILK